MIMPYTALLNSTCTLSRRAAQYNTATGEFGQGAIVAYATAVPCRLRHDSQGINRNDPVISDTLGKTLYIDYRADVAQQDIATVDGVQYSILGITNMGGENKLLSLSLELMKR